MFSSIRQIRDHLLRWFKFGLDSYRPFENKRILCVDDDRDFCLFLGRIAKKLGYDFETAGTLKKGFEKIEEEEGYSAYIIDGHLPDGSGFELAKFIRESKGREVSIGFISRVYQDAVSFRILKENIKVDYVIEKPIDAEGAELFLRTLCGDTSHALEEDFPNEILEGLKREYDATIGEKIESLETAILNVQNKPSLETLARLKNEVHKIAGSAGSYGYTQVSLLCASLDEEIKELLIIGKPIEEKWLNQLDEFFSKIKLYFQMYK